MVRRTLLSILVVGCSANLPLDLFCKIAKNADIESKAETATCKQIEGMDPKIPDDMCKGAFEKGWSAVEAKCPSSALEAMPSPADIEKMIEQEFCAHANDTTRENEFATMACTLANKAAPQVPVEVCEMALKNAWSEVAAECPKKELTVSNPIDTIEKAFCKISKDAAMESKVETITCMTMEHIEPKIPDFLCKKAFDAGWNGLASKCPSDELLSDPVDIAKWIEQEFCSHAGDSTLENEFITTTCTLANKAVSRVPVAVCEMALKDGWTKLAAECPKQVVVRDIPPAIEQALCMLAKNAAVEDKAETATCQAMENIDKTIPDALCKQYFEKGWAALEAKCPSSLAAPSPADIEKWVEEEFCSHAGDSAMENEIATEACAAINKVADQIPVIVCEMGFKNSWGELAAKCPATTTPAADLVV